MRKSLLRLKQSFVFAFAMLAAMGASAQTQITDEAGLKAIANDLAGSYVLTNDITLSEQWTPISTFTGTLDGAGHAIKGLRIAGGSPTGLFGETDGATIKNLRVVEAKVADWGSSKKAGIIVGWAKNNTTIEACFTSGVVEGNDHVGGIIGRLEGTMKNCLSTAASFSSGWQAGGLAGSAGPATFENNVFLGQVYCQGDWGGVGGILGLAEGGTVTMKGNVSAPFALGIERSHNSHMFAMCGMLNGATIEMTDCYASDAIKYYEGAIRTGDPIKDETIIANIKAGKYGGGDPKNVQGKEKSDADLKKVATYTSIGFDAAVWDLADGRYPVLKGMELPFDGDFVSMKDLPEFFLGTKADVDGLFSTMNRKVSIVSNNPAVVNVEGTVLTGVTAGTATITISTTGDAFIKGFTRNIDVTVTSMDTNIATAEDLMTKLAQNPIGEFNITADIDLAGVKFQPLPEFTGILHGNGHVIRNMSYNQSGQASVGLFATTRGATIEDLGFENANMVGNENVGALAGHFYGGVARRIFVMNSYIEGRDHVGSIVGNMGNNNGEPSLITDCISDATVKTREHQVGGLCGIATGGTLQNSLFCGTVDNNGHSSNTGIISLIDSDDATTIQNCFSGAAHINGKRMVPRIVNGKRNSTTLINNYVLKSSLYSGNYSTAVDDKDGDQGATVNDATARTKAFYSETLGWDFDNTWTFLPGAEGLMFPVLKVMKSPLKTRIIDDEFSNALVYLTGDEYKDLGKVHASWGQKIDFQISEGADLVEQVESDETGSTLLYCADENMQFLGAGTLTIQANMPAAIASLFTIEGSNTLSVDIINGNGETEVATADEFVKIGKNPTGKFVLTADIDMDGKDFNGFTSDFSGTIDGQGHKVKNLKVEFNGDNEKGVFYKTVGATIKNIAFENMQVLGHGTKRIGLVGNASGTTFEQVAVTGKVNGDDNVALLTGHADNVTFKNCYVSGEVVAAMQAGGFIGQTEGKGASIENSYFNGDIKVTIYGWAAGFIGRIEASAATTINLKNSVSIGNVHNEGRKAHPFIAVNAAGAGAEEGAVINYSGNILNTDAEIVGDQEWPWDNKTAEGGEVNDEEGYGATELQEKTPYVLIGWDFDNVWTFDKESGYLYPVLKSIGAVKDPISTSIQGVQSEQKAATTGIYDLQGRRMNSQNQLQKGLYIINGRKLVLK
jgi:hypothetical protein